MVGWLVTGYQRVISLEEELPPPAYPTGLEGDDSINTQGVCFIASQRRHRPWCIEFLGNFQQGRRRYGACLLRIGIGMLRRGRYAFRISTGCLGVCLNRPDFGTPWGLISVGPWSMGKKAVTDLSSDLIYLD